MREEPVSDAEGPALEAAAEIDPMAHFRPLIQVTGHARRFPFSLVCSLKIAIFF
jgi:hypothetical protein